MVAAQPGLAGHNAEFAGTAGSGFDGSTAPVDMTTRPRKYAAYLHAYPDSPVTADTFGTANATDLLVAGSYTGNISIVVAPGA